MLNFTENMALRCSNDAGFYISCHKPGTRVNHICSTYSTRKKTVGPDLLLTPTVSFQYRLNSNAFISTIESESGAGI